MNEISIRIEDDVEESWTDDQVNVSRDRRISRTDYDDGNSAVTPAWPVVAANR